MRFFPNRQQLSSILVAAALAGALLAWLSLSEERWASPRLSAAEPPARSASARQLAANTNTGLQREREGTALIDVPGYFKLTGDRATFFPSGSDLHYLALENLNLERIATVITDIPDQIPWVVSGTVTEYRGANYLLVTKAILQTSSSAPNRQAPSAEPTPPARKTQAY